jgi:hypothetical protein
VLDTRNHEPLCAGNVHERVSRVEILERSNALAEEAWKCSLKARKIVRF